MAFQIDTNKLKRLDSWIIAHSRWESIKPWRGASDLNTRPIQNRARKSQTIRKGPEGEIRCALYHTDVVVYWPNGDIELNTYSSVSTDSFANAITPAGMYTKFNGSPFCVCLGDNGWHGNGRIYPISGKILLRKNAEGDWFPVNHTETFTKCALDKKKAREALKKHKYQEFVMFMKALVAMGIQESERTRTTWNNSARDKVELLAQGPAVWRTIHIATSMNRWDKRDYLGDLLSEMRMAIYQVENCVAISEVEYVNKWSEVNNMAKNAYIYRFALRSY